MKVIISAILFLSPVVAFASETPDTHSTSNAKDINRFQTKEVDLGKIKNGIHNAGGGTTTSNTSGTTVGKH
jgi:hypothetical protein